MENLKNLQKMEGWGIVEGFITDRIKAKETEILRLPLEKIDIDKIKILRTEIDTYRSVLKFIQDSIEEGEIEFRLRKQEVKL